MELHFDIAPGIRLTGDLEGPADVPGIVVFVHGSGSSRHSPRNRQVAARLRQEGLRTLLFDLLTTDEERAEEAGARRRFDIDLLAGRLAAVTVEIGRGQDGPQRIGLFGASTGAAGALVTAAEHPELVAAVVSRGGRPDLAGAALERVRAPVLLIVGGDDEVVIGMNRQAATQLRGPHELVIVPGATHLFQEPGTLEAVADLAAGWFARYLLD